MGVANTNLGRPGKSGGAAGIMMGVMLLLGLGGELSRSVFLNFDLGEGTIDTEGAFLSSVADRGQCFS